MKQELNQDQDFSKDSAENTTPVSESADLSAPATGEGSDPGDETPASEGSNSEIVAE